MSIILYLITIVVANLSTVMFNPTVIGILVIPPSAYFMGFTFILGNLIQDKFGTKVSRICIWLGLVLSSIMCFVLDFSQFIVIASALAFLVSQYVTNILYKLLSKTSKNANLTSSLIGSVLDVTLFVTIGLSPIGINTVPWNQLIFAIVGQLIVQTLLQLIASKLLDKFYKGGKSTDES